MRHHPKGNGTVAVAWTAVREPEKASQSRSSSWVRSSISKSRRDVCAVHNVIAIEPHADHAVVVGPLHVAFQRITDVYHLIRLAAELGKGELEDARVRFWGSPQLVGEKR